MLEIKEQLFVILLLVIIMIGIAILAFPTTTLNYNINIEAGTYGIDNATIEFIKSLRG